jgi:transcriptional regulator with XRE-family HTH domain
MSLASRIMDDAKLRVDRQPLPAQPPILCRGSEQDWLPERGYSDLSNAEVARRARLSERRFGNYVTDIREPDLQTLTILARVLGISADELLGITAARITTERDRLLGQIVVAVDQLTEADLKIISVQLRAVAAWRTE